MAGVRGGWPWRGGSLRSQPQSVVDRTKLRLRLAAELAAFRIQRERSFKQSSPPAEPATPA